MKYRFNLQRGKITLAIFILLLAGIILYFNLSGIMAKFARVSFISRQEVRKTVAVQGILLKNEKLLVTPARGQIKWLVQAGVRARVHEPVAQVITPGGEILTIDAPVAGLLSYSVDGLEQVLTAQAINNSNLPDLTGLQTVTVNDGDQVDPGQTVGKIVDNLDSIYVFMEPGEDAVPPDMLAEGKRWILVWNSQDISAAVALVRESAKGREVFLQIADYPDQLVLNREVDFQVVVGTISGYLVPQSAIVNKNGKPGLYLVDYGQARWLPVTISGELNRMVDVNSTALSPEASYVVNPRWVKEGAWVK